MFQVQAKQSEPTQPYVRNVHVVFMNHLGNYLNYFFEIKVGVERGVR